MIQDAFRTEHKEIEIDRHSMQRAVCLALGIHRLVFGRGRRRRRLLLEESAAPAFYFLHRLLAFCVDKGKTTNSLGKAMAIAVSLAGCRTVSVAISFSFTCCVAITVSISKGYDTGRGNDMRRHFDGMDGRPLMHMRRSNFSIRRMGKRMFVQLGETRSLLLNSVMFLVMFGAYHCTSHVFCDFANGLSSFANAITNSLQD